MEVLRLSQQYSFIQLRTMVQSIPALYHSMSLHKSMANRSWNVKSRCFSNPHHNRKIILSSGSEQGGRQIIRNYNHLVSNVKTGETTCYSFLNHNSPCLGSNHCNLSLHPSYLVDRAPKKMQPYLKLMRVDKPIGM